MASLSLVLKFVPLISFFNICLASRILTSDQLLRFHSGALLRGNIAVNLIWYGQFTPTQKAVVSDFVVSLSSSSAAATPKPSVAAWWKSVEKYYSIADPKNPNSPNLRLGRQIPDAGCSLGKSLSEKHIVRLASRGDLKNAINVVLTAKDVAVDGFCLNRCGTHGSRNVTVAGKKRSKFAYIWVGNSETQCPGFCAWPFHQPLYGPQSPPLIAPNNDVGLDGIVMSLGGLLAGTATNPFKSGFYQGPIEAPLEAATACPGVYAKGAYPGYAGDLLVDPTTGASYNAHGVHNRKYLLPAIYDPHTSKCSTLV